MSYFRRANAAVYSDAVSITRADRHLTREELERFAPSTYQEEAHGSRSDRYAHVSTREVIRALYAEGFAPYGVHQSRVRDAGRRGFQKHSVTFQPRDPAAFLTTPTERRVGQAVRAGVQLTNSHDGSGAFVLSASITVLICLNGMTTGKTLDRVRVPHTLNAVTGVIDATRGLANRSRELFPLIEAMQGTELDRQQRLDFAQEALELRYGAGADFPVTPERVLEPLRYEEQTSDLWTTYNVVQERLMRGGQRSFSLDDSGRWRRRTTRAVTGIDQSASINDGLWDAARARLAA